MSDVKSARHYARLIHEKTGKVIVEVVSGKKVPAFKQWTSLTESRHEHVTERGRTDNAGIVLGERDCVIDVDVGEGKDGKNSLRKLVENTGVGVKVNVRTQSGGAHIYYTLPEGIRVGKEKMYDVYPSIEFKSLGRQVLIAGSYVDRGDGTRGVYELPRKRIGDEWIDWVEMPQPMVQHLTEIGVLTTAARSIVKRDVSGDNFLEAAYAYGLVTDEVMEITFFGDPSTPAFKPFDAGCSREEWISLLGSIKTRYAKDDETEAVGREFGRRWSMTAPDKYPGDKRFYADWSSLQAAYDKEGVAAGVGRIAKKEREWRDLAESDDELDETLAMLRKANTEMASFTAMKQFKSFAQSQFAKHSGNQDFMDGLAKSIVKMMDRLEIEGHEIYGERKIKKNWLSVNHNAPDGVHFADATVQQFAEALVDWYFLAEANKYINMRSVSHVVDKTGFNNSFDQLSHSLFNASAANVASKLGIFANKILVSTRYDPSPELDNDEYPIIVEENEGARFGRELYLNEFTPDSVCPVADEITDEGRKAIEMFEMLIDLCVGETDRKNWVVKNWVIESVVERSRKSWGIFICGKAGGGKSMLLRILYALHGMRNSNQITMEQLVAENFNSFGRGATIAGVDELEFAPRKSVNWVIARFKSFLTSKFVTITDKGKDPKVFLNTMRYIVLGNHFTAMGISENERRWFICRQEFHNPRKNQVAFEEKHGMTYKEFFDYLRLELLQDEDPEMNAMQPYTKTSLLAQLKLWMVQRGVDSEFKALEGPPVTHDQKALIGELRSGNYGWKAILVEVVNECIYEMKNALVTEEYICAEVVWAMVNEEWTKSNIDKSAVPNTQKTGALYDLDWIRASDEERVVILGDKRTIYIDANRSPNLTLKNAKARINNWIRCHGKQGDFIMRSGNLPMLLRDFDGKLYPILASIGFDSGNKVVISEISGVREVHGKLVSPLEVKRHSPECEIYDVKENPSPDDERAAIAQADDVVDDEEEFDDDFLY